MTFCTDIDLLHWEPNLLADTSFASQTLLSGTGDLSGTTFTLDSGSLSDAHVEVDHVLVLGPGAISGCFPIVSVDSATQLTVSVLYDRLFPPDDTAPVATAIGTAADLPFVVRTFWPQRRVVSELLLRSAGVDPSEVDETPEILVNPQSLRRACTLGVLQMIYSALAAASDASASFEVRAELYERLYRRAMRSVSIELDMNGDGEGDLVRPLNVVRFQRR